MAWGARCPRPAARRPRRPRGPAVGRPGQDEGRCERQAQERGDEPVPAERPPGVHVGSDCPRAQARQRAGAARGVARSMARRAEASLGVFRISDRHVRPAASGTRRSRPRATMRAMSPAPAPAPHRHAPPVRRSAARQPANRRRGRVRAERGRRRDGRARARGRRPRQRRLPPRVARRRATPPADPRGRRRLRRDRPRRRAAGRSRVQRLRPRLRHRRVRVHDHGRAEPRALRTPTTTCAKDAGAAVHCASCAAGPC